jgi:hypothetical protein
MGQQVFVARQVAEGIQVRIAFDVDEIGKAFGSRTLEIVKSGIGAAFEGLEAGHVIQVHRVVWGQNERLLEYRLGFIQLAGFGEVQGAAGELVDAAQSLFVVGLGCGRGGWAACWQRRGGKSGRPAQKN